MQAENQLIAQLTGKAGLADTQSEDWIKLTRQYPAFNLGYYFLSKTYLKDQNNSSTQLPLQASQLTAALHFNDIRWLDYLLKSDDITSHTTGNQASQAQAILASAQAATEPATVARQDQAPVPVFQENAASGDIAALNEGSVPVEPGDPAPAAPAAPAVPVIAVAPEQTAPENDRLSQVLSQQLADFKRPVAKDAKLEVERDPLYKTDYFASQGIAVVKNLQADGLDKKVRRFTDWLKEMKQQTPTNAGVPQLNTTPEEEAAAAQKAASSLKNEPILTESMAEVLVSQGKTDQAKAVYKKLSLLYPEKTTYFASKIDLLQ